MITLHPDPIYPPLLAPARLSRSWAPAGRSCARAPATAPRCDTAMPYDTHCPRDALCCIASDLQLRSGTVHAAGRSRWLRGYRRLWALDLNLNLNAARCTARTATCDRSCSKRSCRSHWLNPCKHTQILDWLKCCRQAPAWASALVLKQLSLTLFESVQTHTDPRLAG